MFSSIKIEEYMESELSGIFRVKLVTKNIVRGSPGTQFMHMRVKVSYTFTIIGFIVESKLIFMNFAKFLRNPFL